MPDSYIFIVQLMKRKCRLFAFSVKNWGNRKLVTIDGGFDGGSQKALGDGTAELSLVVIATETETVAGNTAEFWQKQRKTFPGSRPYPFLLLVKATESNSCCNIEAIAWLRILFSSDKSCLSAHPLLSEEEQVSLKGSQQ